MRATIVALALFAACTTEDGPPVDIGEWRVGTVADERWLCRRVSDGAECSPPDVFLPLPTGLDMIRLPMDGWVSAWWMGGTQGGDFDAYESKGSACFLSLPVQEGPVPMVRDRLNLCAIDGRTDLASVLISWTDIESCVCTAVLHHR